MNVVTVNGVRFVREGSLAAVQRANRLEAALATAGEAMEAALDEFQVAEGHHRWHHEQEGRPVEERDERLAVLLQISEAIDEASQALES